MTLESRDPSFTALVGHAVECEKVATGFGFTEGPLWNAQEQCLLFSDIPGNRIHRWSAGAGVTVFREPSHMANGLTADRQGRLIACEHATSRVTRTEADGRISVLASHYEGKELNSPNDVVVKSDGAIYFSDPGYGRMAYYGVEREPQLAFRGVYRVAANGAALTLLASDFGQPNGLCFSADEALLFVNDTERQHIRVFDVAADGTVSGGRLWAQVSGKGPGAPDGMKIDSQGNLYCTGPGGIHVFDHAANCLGVIHVPESAANFTWGEADRCSLFITATHSLYRARVRVPGRGP
ncbi:MAG: SMP-30/gluconolactonase/LRE family protein [Burkholderiales bacterium]